jgi:lysozyme family protein
VDSDIKKILNDVLEREGWPKYTEHPHDRGGPTKGGITIRTLEQWRQRRVTRQELERLPKNEALAILERRYVDSNGINKIQNRVLREQVIDNAVLSGPVLAAKDLQTVLDVDVDGIIGTKTLTALIAQDQEYISNKLAVVRSLRLARFVQKNPKQLTFLVGWLRRTLGFVT